jgi:hypothetical protein
LERRALTDDQSKRREARLGVIELIFYSGKTKVQDVDFQSFDLETLKETFEELHEYQSDEHGEDDTDLSNEGQTIVEINRIAGMDLHFDNYQPKSVLKKTRRFF